MAATATTTSTAVRLPAATPAAPWGSPCQHPLPWRTCSCMWKGAGFEWRRRHTEHKRAGGSLPSRLLATLQHCRHRRASACGLAAQTAIARSCRRLAMALGKGECRSRADSTPMLTFAIRTALLAHCAFTGVVPTETIGTYGGIAARSTHWYGVNGRGNPGEPWPHY